MSIVKVTRKRQLILPKEACERLGIAPGDYVRVCAEGDRVIVEKALGINELAGALNPGYKVRKLSEEPD